MNVFKIISLFFSTTRIKKNTSFRKKKDKNPLLDATKTALHKTKNDFPSQLKLVFTGSVGAGKTTAINIVSEKEAINTESKTTDKVAVLKNRTTVAMDYGSYHHKLNIKINLYGTPGQERFGFMSSILTKGANGLIILINNNQEEPLNNLEYYLKNNEEFLQKNPAVIVITHFDESKSCSISDYHRFMEKLGMKWPVVSIDARKKSDIHELLDSFIEVLLYQMTN